MLGGRDDQWQDLRAGTEFVLIPIPKRLSRLVGVLIPAFLTPALLIPGPARATVQLLVQQVGNDVVITGSGSANTTGLTAAGTDNDFTNVLTDTQIYTGPDAFGDGSGGGGDVSLWSGLTGPLSFGSDSLVAQNPSSGSGDLFGILANDGSSASQLVLPLAYSSGASLSGTSTFTGTTLAQLGLTPGQISTWTWGSGANADNLRLEVMGSDTAAVPAPLPIAGAAVAFHRSRRLRRRCRPSPR